MNRRLWLHAFTSVTVCTLLSESTFAAAWPPLASPLQSPQYESTEPDAPETARDPLYAQAVAVVMTHKEASISLVQRHLKLGYNRVACMFESMAQAGLISSQDVHGFRQIRAPGCSSASGGS